MDITYRLEGFEFEWDETKARSNVEKHGVTFEEAAEVFLDPFYIVGDASANREEREFALEMSEILGLSEQEAKSRRTRGLGNNAPIKTSRSYAEIFRQNVFTFTNSVLIGIGAILVLLGRPGDAIVSVGVMMLNVVIGVIQESRSKYQLDKITLLTRPTVTVVRDGSKRSVDPSEIVRGDVLLASAGDQVVVDGVIIGDGQMEVDESLLTGESDLTPKQTGDRVYSGSFCVTGSAFYEAQKVGKDSFANQLTASARTFRQILTPLQQEINLVIRLLIGLVSYFLGLLALIASLKNIPIVESVQMAAVVAGLIPIGLIFMITVAYALGALRMVKMGALVQQMNAIESLSNVDVLCLDKTGTITANRITLERVHPIDMPMVELTRLLGIYAASTTAGNRTSEAIAHAYPESAHPVWEEIMFSSDRKWSALTFDQPDVQGMYLLGAPEILQSVVLLNPELQTQIDQWTASGLRVLLFAHQPEVRSLHDSDRMPQLPSQLTPIGMISFRDELRPRAREILHGFVNAGIQLKIISGDHPGTVAAIAKQVGLDPDLRTVSGIELAAMDDLQFTQIAEEVTIFGRITPQDKARLVEVLRSQGHYVAMIGDGVNDVMSLKAAQLGIAMQSGSAATRGVADMVLLNDSFAALLPAVEEGQRIINGMKNVLRLFLVRILHMSLLINSAAAAGVDFPFVPKNSSLLLFLTVGIPPFALAAWARPGRSSPGLVRSVLHFVLPAALMMFLLTTTVYIGYLLQTGEQAIAQSALVTVAIMAGLLLLPFVEPPTKFWVGGAPFSGDWKPTLLAIGLLAIYAIILAIPPVRTFFDLVLLDKQDYVLLAGIVVIWGLILRLIWRNRWVDRFLDIDLRLP
ncbi:MAG: HAD-IC family P-type ATPase [Cyanobacteria bacterium RU_5_0]|nr:HAD-IC family P-type ATPase [Cyanobacteria bacterium RU_5_0]